MITLRTASRVSSALLVLAAAGYLVAAKRDLLEPRPAVLAVLAVAAMVAVAWVAAQAVLEAVRGPRRMSAGAEALVAAGLLTVAGAGLANWALGMQGFVVLQEREPLRLSRTEDINAFTRGPLANLRELDLTIALARLRLEAAGEGGFRVVSRLKVLDAAGEEQAVEVSRSAAAPFRSLVFRQGAFGFAPHVVVTRDGRILLDAHVPFRTIREGPDGLAFVEDFEIESEGLLFRAAITLEDLNDEMKGHPVLELVLERKGERIGAGTLKPGAMASVDAYRIGFAGLKRWSEIDISRRSYPTPIRVGLVLLALGVVVLPLAAWRRW